MLTIIPFEDDLTLGGDGWYVCQHRARQSRVKHWSHLTPPRPLTTQLWWDRGALLRGAGGRPGVTGGSHSQILMFQVQYIAFWKCQIFVIIPLFWPRLLFYASLNHFDSFRYDSVMVLGGRWLGIANGHFWQKCPFLGAKKWQFERPNLRTDSKKPRETPPKLVR